MQDENVFFFIPNRIMQNFKLKFQILVHNFDGIIQRFLLLIWTQILLKMCDFKKKLWIIIISLKLKTRKKKNPESSERKGISKEEWEKIHKRENAEIKQCVLQPIFKRELKIGETGYANFRILFIDVITKKLFLSEGNTEEFSTLSYNYAVKFIREREGYHVYLQENHWFSQWSWMPSVGPNWICKSTMKRCHVPVLIHFHSNPNLVYEQVPNFACPTNKSFYEIWKEETDEFKKNEIILFYVYNHVSVIVLSELILTYVQNEDRALVIDVSYIMRQNKDGLCYVNLCAPIFPNERYADENTEDDSKGKVIIHKNKIFVSVSIHAAKFIHDCYSKLSEEYVPIQEITILNSEK